MAKVLTVLYNLYVIGFFSTTPKMRMWYMCSGMWPRISHLWLYCISPLNWFFFFWQRMTGFKKAAWGPTFWAAQIIFIMSENINKSSPSPIQPEIIIGSSLPFLHIKSWVKFTLCTVWKGWMDGFFWTLLCPWTNV